MTPCQVVVNSWRGQLTVFGAGLVGQVESPLFDQAGFDHFPHRTEKGHVFSGISDLCLIERAPAPVGQGDRFVHVLIEVVPQKAPSPPARATRHRGGFAFCRTLRAGSRFGAARRTNCTGRNH